MKGSVSSFPRSLSGRRPGNINFRKDPKTFGRSVDYKDPVNKRRRQYE